VVDLCASSFQIARFTGNARYESSRRPKKAERDFLRVFEAFSDIRADQQLVAEGDMVALRLITSEAFISLPTSPTVCLQRVVHSLCETSVHPFDHVGVGVEGDAYARVAQKLLDVLRVLARHEEDCGASVRRSCRVIAGSPALLGTMQEAAYELRRFLYFQALR
jgi:hypothetical protein